ncbi:MAG: ParB/RepB/Spo0J family partition protein [Oscillospiraceae bacterium]|jgi:ParB family chromosome partitioning protein|nr:ParB/RepB/Spo0J family partition protein [Oscillospiraceae bacterium]
MAAKKGGLGRGLDSLFEDNGLEEQSAASAVRLRLMDVEPNREQPRRDFEEEALTALSQSIAEHGVLQPILVRPLPGGTYQIIAGERRWRAARLAGLAEIPAVVKELSDEEAMAAALIENLQREDLNPMEEAQGYQRLMETFGLTQEEAARRVGKSRPVVANALRLLRLPEELHALLRGGRLSGGHARALLGLVSVAEIVPAANEVLEKDLSVRETEKLVKRRNAEEENGGEQTMPKERRASFFDEVELSLAQSLGRKIKVQTSGREEAGRLVIDFFEREDLARLAHALSALEE